MRNQILIIDDDEKNRRLARDFLTARGYTPLEAIGGQQGIELAQQQHPDLILMDIHMPVLDGLEVTRVLKADPATAGIPIIALTALAMRDEEERISQAGCDGYLRKPYHLQELLDLIAVHLTE